MTAMGQPTACQDQQPVTPAVDLDALLEQRSAAVRAHDASPGRKTRAQLIDAARAYRAAQGRPVVEIDAEEASIIDRLNTVFGEPA